MSPLQKLMEEIEEEQRQITLLERKVSQRRNRVEVLKLMVLKGPEAFDSDIRQNTSISHREAAREVHRTADAIRKYIVKKELAAFRMPGKREWFISLTDWERFKSMKNW